MTIVPGTGFNILSRGNEAKDKKRAKEAGSHSPLIFSAHPQARGEELSDMRNQDFIMI